MRALGAHLVKAPFDACWEAMERRTFPGVDGTFVHPFDDDDFIAGNATMGLEIFEDLPEVRHRHRRDRRRRAGDGRGLGRARTQAQVASSVRSPRLPRPRQPLRGGRHRVSRDGKRRSSTGRAARAFSRGCGSACGVVDGSIVVTLDETKRAMRVLAEKARVIAEGAGALSVAAALRCRRRRPVVAVVSGGNIELSTFCELIGAL